MSITVLVFIGYLVIMAALAWWSRRETGTLRGYYLAGGKLPSWVVAFSANATGESGWLLLGLTGMGYAVGAQAFWVVLGEVIGIALAWTLVARRLKRLSDQTGAITVPDVLSAYFNDKKHILRTLSVLIIVVMVGTYVSAQLVASGKAFSSFMGMDYQWAVLLGAVVIIAYTFVGGHKAVAYTDVVQGMLMLLGLIIVPVVAIYTAGGWGSVTEQLNAIDPGLLSPMVSSDNDWIKWIVIASFLAIGLPFIGVPQLLVRFMSAKSEKELVPASILSVFVILVFDIGAVLAGMAGRALFPDLADQETIFPTLATELFSPVLTGVLMVIVLSAIMSTADSLLLLASSAIVRDFLQKIRGSGKSDKVLASYGKYTTLIIGAIAIAFALAEPKVIFWFVLFAWSGLGAAFGPLVLCMLWRKKTTLQGAVAGMLGGFLSAVVWVLAFKDGSNDLYEMIPGFIVGLTLTILVSKLTYKEKNTDDSEPVAEQALFSQE